MASGRIAYESDRTRLPETARAVAKLRAALVLQMAKRLIQAPLEILQAPHLQHQPSDGTDQGGASREPTQPFAVQREPAVHRAIQPLLELVDALGLLREARDGAHQRRPSTEPAQPFAALIDVIRLAIAVNQQRWQGQRPVQSFQVNCPSPALPYSPDAV